MYSQNPEITMSSSKMPLLYFIHLSKKKLGKLGIQILIKFGQKKYVNLKKYPFQFLGHENLKDTMNGYVDYDQYDLEKSINCKKWTMMIFNVFRLAHL